MTPPVPPRRPGIGPRAASIGSLGQARDRDERITKTPPVGVREQLSIPPREDWENPKTDPDASDYDATQARIKRAADYSVDAAASGRDALAELGAVRKELREDIRANNHRIDVLGEHVGNLREGFGELAGEQRATNATLGAVLRAIETTNQTLISQQQNSQKITTTTLLSKVEVETEEKRDVIKARAWTREQIGKAIAWVFGGGGIIVITSWIAKSC